MTRLKDRSEKAQAEKRVWKAGLGEYPEPLNPKPSTLYRPILELIYTKEHPTQGSDNAGALMKRLMT